MLLLSRRDGEKITCTLGEVQIEIELVSIKGHTVRIGLTAPPEVSIFRNELIEKEATDDRS
jgi:carbon storage regulator CsrA